MHIDLYLFGHQKAGHLIISSVKPSLRGPGSPPARPPLFLFEPGQRPDPRARTRRLRNQAPVKHAAASGLPPSRWPSPSAAASLPPGLLLSSAASWKPLNRHTRGSLFNGSTVRRRIAVECRTTARRRAICTRRAVVRARIAMQRIRVGCAVPRATMTEDTRSDHTRHLIRFLRI